MKKKIIAAIAALSMTAAILPVMPVSAAEPKPVLQYTFDGKKELTDENGKNELKLSGGASVTNDGNVGKALLLDGVDGFAQLPSGIMSDSMTITAWVKMSAFRTWGRVFDLGTDSNNNFFLSPYSGGTARIEMKSPSGVDTMDTVQETERDWVHYAVTYNKGTLSYYRNGLLIGSKANLSIKPTDIKDELNYIGKSHYDGDAYLSAAIDDFRIYDKALTAQEIGAVFAEGKISPAVLLGSYAIESGALVTGDSITLPQTDGLTWTETDELGLIDTKTGAVKHIDNTAKVTLTAEYGGEKAEYFVYVTGTSNSPYSINIDAADRSKDVSDIMWGLFFEDINSAADGGLYAELIENRSFEIAKDDHLYSWETDGDVAVNTENPMNKNNPTYVTLTGEASIINDGFDGISLKKGETYEFSMYVRGKGTALIYINNNGEYVMNIPPDASFDQENTDEWQKYTGTFTAEEDLDNATIEINLFGGTLDIDMVSLIPQDTYKGHGLRKDFMEALEAMHPKFLRFPGGCAVEGNDMSVAWNWKDTVGDISERKEMVNIWSPADGTYQMTYGLGFYEYFQMCEDLGMEPVPILNCGIACQVRSGSAEDEAHLVPMDKLQPYIDDAIDLIEFANGTDESNKWVKLRIEMGHPEPFNMKYIGIGNEQYGDIYFERYNEFAKQIHAKYPDMNLVTTSGTASSGTNNDLAWNWINANTELADRVDEHYYESADWFREHAYRYDNYRRDTNSKVFLGEYASKGNAWYNALSEAAFMTGLERNADIVRMASYAPMFAKYGNVQWSAANMIWFTNDDYMLTPNYYVQSLFSNNKGDYTLPTEVELQGIQSEDYLHGGVVLGSWGTQNEFKDAKIEQLTEGNSATADVAPADWQIGIGEWTVGDDGVISQTGDLTGSTVYNDWAAANPQMVDRDYTFTVKAKKNGGGEGFQIGVAAEDNLNYYRVNIGGWGNTTAKIQHIVNGVSVDVGNVAEQSYVGNVEIKEGEWYDVKVEVSDYEIKAYLNGEFICSYAKPKSYGPIYASSVYDEKSGEVIVKVVNTMDSDVDVDLNISGMEVGSSVAKTTVMSGDTSIENSLENKNAIAPVEGEIKNASNNFIYNAPADSFSIIRLQAGGTDTGHKAYISGYENGTFKPDNSITRAEAAAMIFKITTLKAKDQYTNHFTDVNENAWYKDYVCRLADNGCINGYADGTFKPENPITRAEFATIIGKFIGIEPETLSKFSDVPSTHWAAKYIDPMALNGLLKGYVDGTFHPDNTITRAEAVTMINKAWGRDADVSGSANPFSDVNENHWAYNQILEAAVAH
ncbi:MAG: S-layer homology domain-containing protein [Oscillospiraceae bacterium]|nr:S-layer homology domain-containing protein [Oscillospiraceae bacterium]